MGEGTINQAGGRAAKPLHFAILLLYGVVLTWPALSNGYVLGRDVLIHLEWSTHFSDELWSGEWYPRWLDRMNGGLGSPVFFFYGPLPYYFTAALKPLFQADPEGWHQLGVAASMAVFLSGLSMYGWLRKLGSSTGALIGAVVYMGAPYHLALDLFERFAFAELWAFVWLPLVLWGVQAAARGSRKGWLGLSVSYAALVLTHLPTTMIFSPVVLGYAVFEARREGRVRGTSGVVTSMALGAALAAIYLVPALATQHNVSFPDMRVGHLSYANNFLFYGPRMAVTAELMAQLSWYAGISMIACLVAFMLVGRGFVGLEFRVARFWLVVAALAFSMMLVISRPVWDLLPPLQAIQFPWRFNALLTLAVATLVALAASSLKPQAPNLNGFVVLVVCAIVVGQSFATLSVNWAVANTPGPPSLDKMLRQLSFNGVTKEIILAAGLGVDAPEYRPRWTLRRLYGTSSALRDLLRKVEREPAGADRKPVTVLSRSPRRLVLGVEMPAEGWVKLPHFYYPEWRAVTGGTAIRLPVRPSVPEGLLEVKAGAGRHEIVLELVPSTAEKIGWWISSVSLILLGVIAARAFRRKRSDVQAVEPALGEGRVRAM